MSGTATLRVSKATARKLKLGSRTLAERDVRCYGEHTATVRLKPAKAAAAQAPQGRGGDKSVKLTSRSRWRTSGSRRRRRARRSRCAEAACGAGGASAGPAPPRVLGLRHGTPNPTRRQGRPRHRRRARDRRADRARRRGPRRPPRARRASSPSGWRRSPPSSAPGTPGSRATSPTRPRVAGGRRRRPSSGWAGSTWSSPTPASARTAPWRSRRSTSCSRVLDVNLTGVVRTVSAALPHVTARRGYVMITASAAAFGAFPGMATYCASKAGVEHFANALRLEVAHKGVAVGTIHPAWIDTDLVRDQQAASALFDETLDRSCPAPPAARVSLEACAEAIADGMERRRRKVHVPRGVGGDGRAQAAAARRRGRLGGRGARRGRWSRSSRPRRSRAAPGSAPRAWGWGSGTRAARCPTRRSPRAARRARTPRAARPRRAPRPRRRRRGAPTRRGSGR